MGRMLNLFIGDMYNRCTCPLQPCRHLTLKLFIQGHPWSAKVLHIADFKVRISPLLLVLKVCSVKPTYRKSWAGNLCMWSDLTLDPSFNVKQGYSNLKLLFTCLLLVLEVCNVKPTYRKSWVRNLLMWSDLTLGPSFKVKRGQSNLSVLITHLLLVLEVCNLKPTYRKSWAGNLLI